MPEDIAQVSIDLQTTAVSRKGFGTPLFIDTTRRFRERVRTYANLAEAQSDNFADGENTHEALEAFFAQNPTPSQVKIGRREAVLVLTPTDVADGSVHKVTITDTDGDSVTATFTAGALDDEEAVATDLAADINGDADVSNHVTATVVGTGSSAVLEIDADASSDTFAFSGEENLGISYTTSEAAADVLSAVEAEDDDFYFITAHDHSETFVLAMAQTVEAKSKLYFVGNRDAGAIGTLADPATDILGKLEEFNYDRTATIFHHTADTTFTEDAFVGRGAPFDPGTLTWANQQLAGVSTSSNPSTEKDLSSTEKNNLDARNANYVRKQGGVDVTWPGKVVSGKFIDEIRSRDFLEARITEALQNLLINANKIPYTDRGINQVKSTVTNTLDKSVSSEDSPNILQEINPYTVSFPRAKDVSFADKAARTLTGSFTAFLAGAVHITKINGTLTLEATG